MRILVVSGDRALRDALRRTLGSAGFDVVPADNGQGGLALAATARPDAVVVDRGVAGVDGLEVCRRLRATGDAVPVLMLSAPDTVDGRLDALAAGADDVLGRPFDLRELEARLQAVLRRAGAAAPKPALRFAELELDGERHGVVVGDEFVLLTDTEFRLLELLLGNPCRVLTRELIHQRVWGCDFGPESNGLRVYVGYLRRKMQAAGARPLIHTLHGVGYMLGEPDSSI